MRPPLPAQGCRAGFPLRRASLNAHPRKAVRDALVGAIAPLAQRAYRERPRLRVLSLHDVDDRESLAHKLRRLAERCCVVSLGDAFRRSDLDPDRLNVVISFDDGLREHLTIAAPVLKELALPATFFVPSGALDLGPEDAARFSAEGLRRRRRLEFMTSPELAALAAEPLFEVGGHSRSHADLGSRNVDLGAEIAGDKATLERITGRPVDWFAYPFGSPQNVSPEAARAIEAAGYLAAFTIVPAFWSRTTGQYVVGRDALSIEANDRLWDAWLRGGYDALSRLKYRGYGEAGSGRGPLSG